MNYRSILFSDVDGCLTDGTVYYLDNGVRARKFSVVDGHGVQLLRENGIYVVFLSGENDKCIRERAHKLQVPFFHALDKAKFAAEYLDIFDFSPENIYAFGDDLPDLELLRLSDFCGCPNNAQKEVRQLVYEKLEKYSGYKCYKNGGEGAFREFANIILSRD